ncbi:hypothetical protein TWF281_004354 [Arthrobotrys megalospora]
MSPTNETTAGIPKAWLNALVAQSTKRQKPHRTPLPRSQSLPSDMEYNRTHCPDPENPIHGCDITLKTYDKIPRMPSTISLKPSGFHSQTSVIATTRRKLKTMITSDPSNALVERLMEEFRADYEKCAVATYKEETFRKMFLLKYRGYRFKNVQWDGEQLEADWVDKGRFGGKRGGKVVWKQRGALEWIEEQRGWKMGCVIV